MPKRGTLTSSQSNSNADFFAITPTSQRRRDSLHFFFAGGSIEDASKLHQNCRFCCDTEKAKCCGKGIDFWLILPCSLRKVTVLWVISMCLSAPPSRYNAGVICIFYWRSLQLRCYVGFNKSSPQTRNHNLTDFFSCWNVDVFKILGSYRYDRSLSLSCP